MVDKKVITYSLLAHINNTGALSKGLLDVFVPIVKRALSKFCAEGKTKGDSIIEIQVYIKNTSDLDIPLSILRKILQKISEEINKDLEHPSFQLFNDDAFTFNDYLFTEYEEFVRQSENDLEKLNTFFVQFLESKNFDSSNRNIYEFVDTTKYSLGKYLNPTIENPQGDFSLEAQFTEFIREIPRLFEILKNIYLGSVISAYLSFEPTKTEKNVELVLDTNFIISLLDLNSPEAYHTSTKLIEIAKSQGYKITVLAITLKETEGLLTVKSENFDKRFLSKQLDPEDIYNACSRRSLTKTDLTRIAANLEKEMHSRGFTIVYHTEKYENKAKYSPEYQTLVRVRNTTFAALHDATAIEYVKEKRGRPVQDFFKVKCWFVNNSSTKSNNKNNPNTQPYIIKGEDLLNLLWLSTPMIMSSVPSTQLVDVGLNRLISSTLSETLPKSSIIRELDENIQKYAKDEITDTDVVRIGNGIAHKSLEELKNLEPLNKLAEEDSKAFVRKLSELSQKLKEIEKKKSEEFNRILEGFNSEKNILKERNALNEKQNEENYELKRKLKENKSKFIAKSVRNWQNWGWVWLIAFIFIESAIVLLVLKLVFNGNIKHLGAAYKDSPVISLGASLLLTVFTFFGLRIIYDRNFNHSNIENYKKGIESEYDDQ